MLVFHIFCIFASLSAKCSVSRASPTSVRGAGRHGRVDIAYLPRPPPVNQDASGAIADGARPWLLWVRTRLRGRSYGVWWDRPTTREGAGFEVRWISASLNRRRIIARTCPRTVSGKSEESSPLNGCALSGDVRGIPRRVRIRSQEAGYTGQPTVRTVHSPIAFGGNVTNGP